VVNAVNVRMSSRGRLVIPGSMRRALGLEPGAELSIEIVEDHLVLTPLARRSPEDELYGMLRDTDVLSELEDDHRPEMGHAGDLPDRKGGSGATFWQVRPGMPHFQP
jgi:AbrB family looped-hinge helix DNA binding protein